MARQVLYLQLEGPLQAWGDHLSKFAYRESFPFPTKSGVIGLLCAALGMDRKSATEVLPELGRLLMGVRIDRPGVIIPDYHTVGAGIGNRTAEGKIKYSSNGELETFVTQREYIADASFLVALVKPIDVDVCLEKLAEALVQPKFQPYLGRKSCSPSRPLLFSLVEPNPMEWDKTVYEALEKAPLEKAPLEEALLESPHQRDELNAIIEWEKGSDGENIPDNAIVLYDQPVSYAPPAYQPRVVTLRSMSLEKLMIRDRKDEVSCAIERKRADYTNSEYKKVRLKRLVADYHTCVFCKAPATDVHHVTYIRAGGEEVPSDLRSLCRLCHDAVSMLEYGLALGEVRIDPCDPTWREAIMQKRREILQWRSLENRRRKGIYSASEGE